MSVSPPLPPSPAPPPAPAPAFDFEGLANRILNALPIRGKTYIGGVVFLALAGWHAYTGDFVTAATDLGLALSAIGLRHAVAKAAAGN